MIDFYLIENVKIGMMPISEGENLTRRQRERSAVSQILTTMLGADYSIGHNQDGAPIIMKGGAPVPSVSISVTHSQKLAAVAIGEDAIGIDAEEWRPALLRVKSRFLTLEETEWVTVEQLLPAWTIKEAVYKAAGQRLLAGPEIHISRDFLSASALGVCYKLHHLSVGDTHFCLAKAF